MPAVEPIRDKGQLRQLAEYYLKRGQLRNYTLIVLGVHTALRISDVLKLTWDDVFNFKTRRIRETVTLTEKKTRKSKKTSDGSQKPQPVKQDKTGRKKK